MNDSERRRYEMLVRVNQFGVDNAGDFPSGVGAAQFAVIATVVNETESKSALQAGGFAEAAQQFEVKDTCRENLRDEMSDISRTAKSMEYEFDGIADKFRFQRNMNDATMLATARAFITEAGPYSADFIAYGLPATFLADLTAAADAFEASFSNTAAATAEHVAATADTSAKIREGMIAGFGSPPARGGVAAFRRRGGGSDGVVQNKYNNDPGKLAAWLSASHTEKAPKKKQPTP